MLELFCELKRSKLYSWGSTSRKLGFGHRAIFTLVPVQSRAGTNASIGPGSCGQGPAGPRGGIGPGSSGPFGPGWWDKPGSMGLSPGPPPLVPVGGLNRDQRLPFSPGSCHQSGPMRCLYIPLAREQSTPVLCFSLAEGERAWWCSSSPPMHTRCSMECLSHTS